ncbi:MAG: hypothetical protein ACP5JG_18475 [Anaerolineae bacterium]
MRGIVYRFRRLPLGAAGYRDRRFGAEGVRETLVEAIRILRPGGVLANGGFEV